MKKRQAQKAKSSTTTSPTPPVIPVPVYLKQPLVVDTSTYNNKIDWSKLVGVVAGAIVKASEGMFIEDSQFKNSWPQLLELGIPRGAYHFYRYYYTSAWNAKKFVNTLKRYGGTKPSDILVLDEEEIGHMSITSMLDFTYNVEQLTGMSHKNMLWYSWPWALNDLSFKKLTQSQVEYIREIGIWVAGYPNNPNLYPDPTSAGYKVDTNKYGQVCSWQYAESVIVPNIPGGTDTNWVSQEFLNKWKGL